MAIFDLSGAFHFPPMLVYDQQTASFGTSAPLDASDERLGVILQAPKSGNIAKVAFSTATVTTGATVDVRVETVDATDGNPSDTLWGTNTNAALVVDGADDNVIKVATLTAVAAVTIGDQLAIVIVNPTASFGSMQIRNTTTQGGGRPINCYYSNFTGGSWTKGVTTGPLLIGLEYDDGSYVPIEGIRPPVSGSGGLTSTGLSTATTPDVMGLRFQFPFAVRVRGAWVIADCDGNTNLNLVTTAYHQVNQTGILATSTLDKDIRQLDHFGMYQVTFPSRPELAADTNYRLIVEPTTASTTSMYDSATLSLAMLGAFHGGANFHLTTAKDPTGDGSWTNFNSGTFRVPYMGLFIDGIDTNPGGGGGGVSRSRFQRRM